MSLFDILKPKSCTFEEQINFLTFVLNEKKFYKGLDIFLNPISILPLAIICNKEQCDYIDDSGQYTDYLDVIKFPKGLSINEHMEWNLQKQNEITYLPIIRIEKISDVDYKENVVNYFAEDISEIFAKNSGVNRISVKNSISYVISEIFQNAFEHGKDDIYIFAQYYKTKKFLDVCIADGGVGIADSYNNTYTDKEGVEKALSGDSSKSTEYGDGERGYGLRTSVNLVTGGYKGCFAIISGDTYYIEKYHDGKVNKRDGEYHEFPSPTKWNGTIVSFRVNIEEVNYLKYVE